MSTGSDLIAMIASRQNLADYQKKHWEGTFDEYLDIVRQHPEVTRTAYQRLYDMILSHGTEEVVREQGEASSASSSSTTSTRRHGDAIFGLDRPLMQLVNTFKIGRPGLRHRAARAPAARPGRQLQEHHRPAAEEGPGAVLADRRRGALHLRLGRKGSTASAT